MAKYHKPGVDPPEVHYQKEGEQQVDTDLAQAQLFEKGGDTQRFLAEVSTCIDAIEERNALQDRIAQTTDFDERQRLQAELKEVSRNVETLRNSLDEHSTALAERFHFERQEVPQLEQSSIHWTDSLNRDEVRQALSREAGVINQRHHAEPHHEQALPPKDQGLNFNQRMEKANREQTAQTPKHDHGHER